MKLISLNILGGKIFEPLMAFVKSVAPDTDIFCFQEVFRSSGGPVESHGTRTNILADLVFALEGFQCYFCPVQKGVDLENFVDFEIETGQAIFAKKSLNVGGAGEIFVYRDRNGAENIQTIPAAINYVQIEDRNKKPTICNFHGLAFPGDKLDTPERLRQSEKIQEFLDGMDGQKILCGDFNLMPDTESIKMIDAKMKNLISIFNIERTRSRLSPFYGKEDFQPFADYTFASPDIKIKSFQVPDLEVSDHLPMILEFD
ncbi:MAG: endonuclease/exonuclease/phosphatase family protein [Candidatus Liptonbacteria bacterium]|nr:endonuclease/exonuclease/phosphatase family protein [Candidatus Liptonbacteria bacterium]